MQIVFQLYTRCRGQVHKNRIIVGGIRAAIISRQFSDMRQGYLHNYKGQSVTILIKKG